VAGSNYSVNITLDTSKVEGKLKGLEKRVATFRQNLAKPLKISAQTQKLEEKKLKMQDAQRASMIQTRKIGDIIQKQEEQGLKVDKARSHLRKAAVLDNQKLFKAAETQRKLAMEELKIEQNELKVKQKQTQELLKQNELERQLSASQGITAQGAFSRLSDRQSRDAEGRRTFMNNRFTGFMSNRFGATRGFDVGSALISGGFPLLFGQGPLGALAGGLGGGIGGMFGQMGGFAGGIAATAALQQITNAINGVKAFGEGLKNVETSLATVTEKSLFSSDATQKRAEQLKKLGKQQELNKLLTRELTIALGGKGLERLKEVGKSSRELARTFGQLGASIQAVLAKAILPGINAINTILSGFTIPSQFKNFKGSLSGADLKRFNEIVLEERGTRKDRGKVVPGMLTNEAKKRSISRAVGEGLGGDLSLLGGTTDPTIEANLDKRIAFLQRSLEVGREQATIEQKIVEFKDKGTDLTEEEIGKKLRLINNLQRTEQLYQKIGSAIENGIVDAIEGAIQGTKTLGEVARSVFAQIQRTLLQAGVNSLLSKLPGKLGAAFAGGAADGGPIKGGKTYLVGERGPELFTPGVSGMVTPNHALGGSTSVVVNVDASGSSVQSDGDGQQFGEALATAIQLEIIKQKRSGGLLS
jgi:hypothetical protein